MTPPAAAAAPRTRTRRTTAPPRRTSGPARGRAVVASTAPPPLALRIGGAVHGLAEHRLLERIIRGRAWIAILGIGLIGIVFMQVSMLRMNAGIGRAVDTATQLERDNSSLRGSISELSSGDHIEAEAAKLGLVAAPGTPRFLDARHFDPARAVASIRRPGDIAVPSTATSATTTQLTATPLPPTGVAPTPDDSSASAPTTSTAPTTTSTPSTTTTAPTASTTPTSTTPAAAPVTPTQPAAQPAASPQPATTGGAAATGQGG